MATLGQTEFGGPYVKPDSTEKRPIPDVSIAVQLAAQNVQAAAGKAYEMLVEVQSGWLWQLLITRGK